MIVTQEMVNESKERQARLWNELKQRETESAELREIRKKIDEANTKQDAALKAWSESYQEMNYLQRLFNDQNPQQETPCKQ